MTSGWRVWELAGGGWEEPGGGVQAGGGMVAGGGDEKGGVEQRTASPVATFHCCGFVYLPLTSTNIPFN